MPKCEHCQDTHAVESRLLNTAPGMQQERFYIWRRLCPACTTRHMRRKWVVLLASAPFARLSKECLLELAI